MCTLALSRYLGFAVSSLLAGEIERIVADRVYEPAVFFLRDQGRIEPTAARRISYQDSLAFERLHEQAYRQLGFRLVDIPAAALAERVALIQRTVARPPR